MTIRTWRLIQTAMLLLLMTTLPACARAYTATPPFPTLTPLAITQPPTQTVAAPTSTDTVTPPTAAPTPTEELSLLPNLDMAFEDVRFTLPAELAGSVDSHIAPELDRLGEIYPAYTEFTLVDYPDRNKQFEPEIQVYPVHELGHAGTQIVQKLKDLLAEKPSSFLIGRGIPILPEIPAGQLIDVQVEYLSFAGGSGIRVLTQLGQDSWPIHNEGLVYIFQGLTSDDAYYISAFLPVTAPFLPDHVDDPDTVPPVDGISYPQFGSPDFAKEYWNYQKAVIQKLNGTPSEEFVPALNLLDVLIQSLQIKPVTDAEGTGNIPCVNGLPTRLHVGGFAYVNPDPPLPNNLRSDAGKNSDLIGDIQPGQAMKIMDGPKCSDGWVWWQVRTLESELVGWTAEGDRQNYWLIPCESRNKCAP